MVRKKIPGKQDGFALLEGLIAIVIFSAGVLAFAWMQVAATRQVTESKYRIEASFAANQLLGQMWTQRSNLEVFVEDEVNFAGLPNGKRSVAVDGHKVTITLSWTAPGETRRRSYQAVAEINA
ncbi:type IV pilus modification PilV family protein [Pseudoduganella sp. OTU4001]|uniref:type IV pilus modification PilV family protein n=1 Tax=Pseudoduganella sp. OTU4001 TaxID=3043854 RepID=UPI00313DDB6B